MLRIAEDVTALDIPSRERVNLGLLVGQSDHGREALPYAVDEHVDLCHGGGVDVQSHASGVSIGQQHGVRPALKSRPKPCIGARRCPRRRLVAANIQDPHPIAGFVEQLRCAQRVEEDRLELGLRRSLP
jgi:hypothetical protein